MFIHLLIIENHWFEHIFSMFEEHNFDQIGWFFTWLNYSQSISRMFVAAWDQKTSQQEDWHIYVPTIQDSPSASKASPMIFPAEKIAGTSLTVWWWTHKCSRLSQKKKEIKPRIEWIPCNTNVTIYSIRYPCVTKDSFCFSKTCFKVVLRIW